MIDRPIVEVGWASAVGLVNRLRKNSCDAVPGFLIEGPDHTPSIGSLANRLRNEVGPIPAPDQLGVTTKIKDIYQSEGLDDLWKVTKQWLDSKGVPTPLN